MNFITPRYAILFLNSEIYIVHIINHERNRSMFVASAVCFVWDTKLDFPIVKVDVFSLVLMFIFFHCLYMFSVFVLVSQTLMWLLIMIVIDDEVIHYDITVSLYMFFELKIRFLLWFWYCIFHTCVYGFVFSVLGIYKLILSTAVVYTSN